MPMETTLISDEAIIRQVLGGAPDFYELLLRRYNTCLYKTGRSYGFNHEDTQDLMQDTFLDAYTHLSRFEQRASFKTWLIKIMLHNCYRKRQKMSFKNEKPDNLGENARPLYAGTERMNPSRVVLNRELRHVLEQALDRVSLDYRLVFSLRTLNGFSVKETADILHISEANVKVRLNRAKAMLRQEVEKSYSTAEIYEFNLIYCDAIVQAVMKKIKEGGSDRSGTTSG